MDYRDLWKEENYLIQERYDLVMERIEEIASENTVAQPFKDYFTAVAAFIKMIDDLYLKISRDELVDAEEKYLKELNRQLYQDILPENYEKSYANPAYAAEKLGTGFGQILSFLYSEIRGEIVFAYESRLTEITILNELFVQIYNLFEDHDSEHLLKEIKDAIYWFESDYTDKIAEYRIRESLDPDLSFARDIIMESDLTDTRYLYKFGEYISENEIAISEYLSRLPQETIDRMADTYTEGYRIGFKVMGRELSKKKTVMIRYELGFERMIKKAVENFKAMGLEAVFVRAAVWSMNRNPNRKIGYFGTSANRQYDYDHRYDQALYMKKAFCDRQAAILKVAYEKYRILAKGYAGPAVVETFGEPAFEPVNKEEALRMNEKQEKLAIEFANEKMQMINEYIPGDETSFTIIAFPLPSIGENFEEIFRETIRINTLDYEEYKCLQQTIIDALDEADYVQIKGAHGNETDLNVNLHELKNKEKETNFENCVADVNIPLGEVFTSPLLQNTTGLLHVSSVYVGSLKFKNLKIWFKDGMTEKYSCDNFEDPKEGEKLIKQVLLKNHESVPMGEFAIGTNTTAYAMAKKYQIVDKLPILIVEKMGPHFAVGDTCYSWSEDSPMYNPNGKEVIARDNEVSILRKEDPMKAYFGCHTDITIPYSELGSICAVKKDGTGIEIIDQGRFVLSGTEKLNEPLDIE